MAHVSSFRPPRARVPHTFDAFRTHSYRMLWPANFFAYISRWMQITLLSWLVLELTDSPFYVALVGFFAMVPLLLFGAFGGVLADRVSRRKLLIISSSSNLMLSLAMLVLLMSGREEFWHAYVVVLFTGLAWALDMPARRSLVYDLFERASLTNAMALDSVGMHASRMLGPTIAGGMIAAVSITGGYVVLAVFGAVSIVLMALVRPPARRPGLQAARSIIRNLAEGFAYVLGNRVILATVVVTVLMNMLLFPYMQMIPVIARDSLGVGPGLMGLLMGADGLGAIVGSMTIASVATIKYHGRIFLGGSVVGLIMSIGFALSNSVAMALPILVLLGLGTAGFGTMQSTIVLLAAREEMRGRALGVISLAIGAGPIGALIIGALASLAGPELAIMMLSATGLLSIAVVSVLMPRLRGQIGAAQDAEPKEATQSTMHSAP